jgi:hypothetical protein
MSDRRCLCPDPVASVHCASVVTDEFSLDAVTAYFKLPGQRPRHSGSTIPEPPIFSG